MHYRAAQWNHQSKKAARIKTANTGFVFYDQQLKTHASLYLHSAEQMQNQLIFLYYTVLK